MPADVAPALRLKPGLGRVGIGHGFRGGKRLGSYQKQRSVSLQALEHAGQFSPVDVRDKVKTLALCRKFGQRQHRHLRPQVRAANADVDDVGDGLIAAQLLRIGQHGFQSRLDFSLRVGDFVDDCLRRQVVGNWRISQQEMHHGTVFRVVDGFSGKHRVALRLHSTLARQLQQQRLAGRIDQVLGQVRKHMRRLLAEIVKAQGVLREGLAQVEIFSISFKKGLQRSPCRRLVAA
jgi:hypothetical protein